MRALFDIVGFQASWWACAYGASTDRWWLGVAISLAVVILQIALTNNRSAIAATVLAAAAVGIAAESALVASSLISYNAATPAIALTPLWLTCLWMVFATCIPATSRMLPKYTLPLAAVLGVITAPPTYWFGHNFGALVLTQPQWLPLLLLAVVWGIATPLLIWVYRSIASLGQPSPVNA